MESAEKNEKLSTHVGRTTKSDDYETPPDLFDWLNDHYRFNVDCAAHATNAKLPDFYSENRSFLTAQASDFAFKRCWLNPPFGMKEVFLRRVVELRQLAEVFVCIVPNNARETDWWRDYVWSYADEIVSLSPRVYYHLNGTPQRNVPFSSCLVIYRPRLNPNSGLSPRESVVRWRGE